MTFRHSKVSLTDQSLSIQMFLLGFLIFQHGSVESDEKSIFSESFALFGDIYLKCIVHNSSKHTIEQHDLVFMKSSSRESKPQAVQAAPYVPLNMLVNLLKGRISKNYNMPPTEPTMVYSCKCMDHEFHLFPCVYRNRSMNNVIPNQLIDIQQAAQSTFGLLLSLNSSDDDVISLEMRQFLHNTVIILKQAFDGTTPKTWQILSFLLGIIQPLGEVNVMLTSLISDESDTMSVATRNNESIAITIDISTESSEPNIHCFPTTGLVNKKLVVWGLLRMNDDYKVELVPVCMNSLANSVAGYVKSSVTLDQLINTFRNSLGTVPSYAYFQNTFLLGNILNTHEPSLWWYHFENHKYNTLTVVRRHKNHVFAIRIGCIDGDIQLPASWKVSYCTGLNIIYDSNSSTFEIDMLRQCENTEQNVNFRTIQPPIKSISKIADNVYLAIFHIISRLIKNGIAKTYDELLYALLGYVHTYNRFSFVTASADNVLFHISLTEKSNMILSISNESKTCFDANEMITKLCNQFAGFEVSLPLLLVSIGIGSNGFDSLEMMSFNSIYFQNYLPDTNSFTSSNETNKQQDIGQTDCSETLEYTRIIKNTSIYRQHLSISLKKRAYLIINCMNDDTESCRLMEPVLDKPTRVFVDQAMYRFFTFSSGLQFGENFTEKGGALVYTTCPAGLHTSILSPILQPIWLFATYCILKREFVETRSAKFVVFSRDCTNMNDNSLVTSGLSTHTIIYITGEFYKRYEMIYEPSKPILLLSSFRPHVLFFRTISCPTLGNTSNLRDSYQKIKEHCLNKRKRDIRLPDRQTPISGHIQITDIRTNRTVATVNCPEDKATINLFCDFVCSAHLIISEFFQNISKVTQQCRVYLKIHGKLTIYNNASFGTFVYKMMDDKIGKLHVVLLSKLGSSLSHVFHVNWPFLEMSMKFVVISGHSRAIKVCDFEADDIKYTFCSLRIKLSVENYQLITLIFNDGVQCHFDTFQSVCMGQTSTRNMKIYKNRCNELSTRVQSVIYIQDDVKHESYLFCGPQPSNELVHTKPILRATETSWLFIKNDPRQLQHIFCSTNTLSTFYDIKIAQPNNVNALFSNPNTVHIRESPEKLAILLSLRRICWQMKERQNELQLVPTINIDDDRLEINLFNRAQDENQHERFKVGLIVFHNITVNTSTESLLNKIHLELEAPMKFKLNTKQDVITVDLVPAKVFIDLHTNLVALQPESAVRPMHFLIQAIVFGKQIVSLYRLEENLVVCFRKNVGIEIDTSQPQKSTVFGLLLLRFFEENSFQHIKLAFLNRVIVLKS